MSPPTGPERPERLPLRYRLPNPPPVFHGREALAARLEALIARAPLTVVVGPGGIGKSALVSHALHASARASGGAVLSIGLRRHDPLDQIWLDVARALTTLRGDRFGWDGALGDPEILAAMAIDLAEAHDATIVVDDLHLARADEVAPWLATLARYAVRGRWIAISRVDPQLPELAEQTLAVGPLAPEALALIAARCAPDRPEAELARAVHSAEGSPYRLRRALVAAAPLDPALGLIELPLAQETLTRLGALGADDVQLMTEAGALVAVPGGLRLHDEARATMLAGLPPDATQRSRARALGILAEAELPAAWCESIRLELERGEVEVAAERLARHFEALVGEGFGPRLWELLSAAQGAASPSLHRMQLRLAAALGRRDALQWATQLAAPSDPSAWLAWLQCAYLAGRFDLLEGADPADAGPFVSFDAAMVRASARIAAGRIDAALALLAAVTPLDRDGAAQRAMLTARCEVLAGGFEAGVAHAHAVLAEQDGLGHDTHAELLMHAATLFMNAGQARAAVEAEARLAALDGAYPLSARRGRQRTVRRFTLEVEHGDFSAARATLATLRRFAGATVVDQALLAMSDARLRVATGELAEVEAMIEALIQQTRVHQLAELHGWLLVMRVYLALALGRAQVACEWPAEFPPLVRPVLRYLEPYRWIHRLRHAPGDPGPAPELATTPNAPADLRIVAALARYEHAQRQGDAEAAQAHARAGLRLAEESGWGTFALEARAALCEAQLVAGRLDALAETVAALEAQARALPSPRYLEVATFFRLALLPAEPRALERALADAHVAPEVRRRQLFLLDPRATADALDRRVVTALVAAAPVLAFTTVGANDGPSWGYDAERAEVWFEDGSTLDLSRHALFGRVLVTLAEAGGAVDHEVLAREVWGIADYHPLRDAKRIHVAMSRLREKIVGAAAARSARELSGASAKRIVTTEAGYAVSDALPFRVRGATRRWQSAATVLDPRTV